MSRFVKPSLEEVSEYMIERGFVVEGQPETFHDYFESKGWMVGKSKMKDWKAAVRNWIRNNRAWGGRNATYKSSSQSFADKQREAAARAYGELEAMERTDRVSSISVIRQTG